MNTCSQNRAGTEQSANYNPLGGSLWLSQVGKISNGPEKTKTLFNRMKNLPGGYFFYLFIKLSPNPFLFLFSKKKVSPGGPGKIPLFNL